MNRALLLLAGLCSCAPDADPAYVYVPADNYAISVEVSVSGEARAGEWLLLSAQRRSGPWKRVKLADAPLGYTPFRQPPPQFEPEVADNVHWITEPGGASFDLPPHDGHRRKVRFHEPGTYKIWARNAYPTEARSNVVILEVKPR